MGQGTIMHGNKPSSMVERKGGKQRERAVEQIADHILEFYKPHDGPIVLMWRDVMNGFHLKLNPDFPTWPRDDMNVHYHFKQFGRGVIKILDHRRFTVVKVGHEIRVLVGHGRPPDRDGKRRTDVAYRNCLPSSSNPAMGIVVFPRDTQEDHPLIVASRERRFSSSTTSMANAISSAQAANDLGNLSDVVRDEMIGSTQAALQKMFIDERYPLFRESVALPPAESNE